MNITRAQIGHCAPLLLILPSLEGGSAKRVYSFTEVFYDIEASSNSIRKRNSQQFKTESLRLDEKLGVPTAVKK